MTKTVDTITGGAVTSMTLTRVEDSLYFDRGNVRDKYSRYLIMLVLSSIMRSGTS